MTNLNEAPQPVTPVSRTQKPTQKTKLKLFISRLLVKAMKFLQWLDTRLTKTIFNSNPDSYEDLTPSDNLELDPTYEGTLLWALRKSPIQNIALTGRYGSGKSSILRTFERRHKEYTYLNISLATFDEKIESGSADARQLVETSILQQIFYKVKSSKIPDSRFKRIRKLGTGGQIIWTLIALIWLLSTAQLFKPGVFNTVTWWKDLSTRKSGLNTISFVIFLAGLGTVPTPYKLDSFLKVV